MTRWIIAAAALKAPDYVVLGGYFAVMLGIGLYFSPQMRGMKEYFSGGNNIPWWLSGVSFYMSSFSAATFVQYSALAYTYGWVAVTLYWVTVPATLVSVLFFARRWRRARLGSPVEYLETRYSAAVRQVFAWHGIPVRVIDDALKLVAIGMFIRGGLGLGMTQSMLGAGLIILAYTCLGGLWAVTVTDFVQFVVMGVAVVILVPLSLRAVGGLAAFMDGAPAGFFRLTHPEYSWGYVLSNVLLFSLAYSSVQWSLIQRYYCVPRERDACKVGWLVVALNIVTPPLMFLPAMAARQFLGGEVEGGQVYAALCTRLLPAGMLGLVMAAMFAATMSMLSSDYNVCAGVLTNDVYRRLIRPQASERELVCAGRAMTLVVGLVALGLAFRMAGVGGEGLFRSMVTLFSIATAPVAIPMLAGLVTRRVSHRAAVGGFLGGVAVGLLLFGLAPDRFELLGTAWRKENAVLLGGTVATAASVLLLCRVARPSREEQERIGRFLDRLATPVGTLPADAPAERSPISPFRVVGVCVALIGGLLVAVHAAIGEPLARGLDLALGLALMALGAWTGIGASISGSRQARQKTRGSGVQLPGEEG